MAFQYIKCIFLNIYLLFVGKVFVTTALSSFIVTIN